MAERKRKSARDVPPGAPEEGTADRIAQRAYERYQERGGEHGRDWEDWFEAEREARNREHKPTA